MNQAELVNIAKLEKRFWWYAGMRRIMLGLLDSYFLGDQRMRILEAGCGTGHFAQILRNSYGHDLYPMDFGSLGLEYAGKAGLDRLTQADICSLPYRSDSFDAVISLDVLVHLKKGDELRALREMARVLAPGGILTVRVAALDALRSQHSAFITEYQRFTKRRLVSGIRSSGLSVLRCTYANSLLLPVAFAKFRVWERVTHAPAVSSVKPVAPWLNKLLEQALVLEAGWIRSGHNLPLGQSLIAVARK